MMQFPGFLMEEFWGIYAIFLLGVDLLPRAQMVQAQFGRDTILTLVAFTGFCVLPKKMKMVSGGEFSNHLHITGTCIPMYLPN